MIILNVRYWDIVRNDMNESDRALLLLFITGTSRVPYNGFSGLIGSNGYQPIQIQKVELQYNNNNVLPTSHTCFNTIDLPEYTNKDILKDKLLTAIREGSQGFGFR